MAEVRRLKAWPTYSGSDGWYSCVLVFENGWAPFGHCCSHPHYAPGDLLLGRPERIESLKKMGIEADLQPIIKDRDIPAEVLAKHKDEANWRAMNDEYESLARPARAEGEGEKK